ncbi:Imm10 family immunity protein [Planotetraspora mira]|uniref:Imm10 family immunity protein n=1 Tax=Planotetraspora mira TaxID=58121 RepID=UPI00194E1CE3|nr:Imm10 family immunity protein [Planotetraspora mira]
MITIMIQEVGIEDEPPLLLVGMAESSEDEGRDFVFQCDLRRNDYQENSNWPEGESYCVANESGLTNYGAVREVELKNDSLRVVFTDAAVQGLRLDDSEYEFRIDSDGFHPQEFRRYLRKVLTCGRPEYHPRLLGL